MTKGLTTKEAVKAILILKHKLECWLYEVGDLTVEEYELIQDLVKFQEKRHHPL